MAKDTGRAGDADDTVIEENLSVQDIVKIASDCGYSQYRDMISSTLYFQQDHPPALVNEVDGSSMAQAPIKIHVYFTTRSIMTYLPNHPTKGANQMWRSSAYQNASQLKQWFLNPRQHTNIGYRKANNARRGCTGCGELKPRKDFSQNQWRLGPDKNRCKECISSSSKKKDSPTMVSDLEDSVGSMRLTADALQQHDAKIKSEEEKSVRDDLERRQFNCPECPKRGRGPYVFFKKVPKFKPLVKCPKCKRASRGKCARILAVPRSSERGYGLYRCHECNDVWGSSRAVGGISQECHSCKSTGNHGTMVLPFRIEVPRPKRRGGPRGMRRVPQHPIAEDAPEEHGYNANDRQRNDQAGGQALFPNIDDNSSTSTRSYDLEPRPDTVTSSSGGPLLARNSRGNQKPAGYAHHCSGCASGICKIRKVPKSQVHNLSDGDTVSTRSSVVTNSSIDKTDFHDRDDDFRAFEVDDDGGGEWITV